MDSSSQEGDGKKKIIEIKTFPVPFALGEKKENISIPTNTPSTPSKEQIINQAIRFHSEGNILEATKSYQNFISQGFKDHRVFSNYGAILRGLGKLQEAEIFYRKAIELNPNFPDAHSNLGSILRDLGKLKDAELSTRKAIELNPNFPDAHSNLGSILSDLGKLKDAELSTRKAIELNPNYAMAHSNLGSILRDLGKLQESFDSYLRVIEINPTPFNIYPSITRFLQDSDPSQLNQSKLKNILNLLLERNDISHKELKRAFNFLYSKEIIRSLENFDSDFSEIELLIKDKILINALKKIIFCNFQLEELLTKVRRNICNLISKNQENINYSQLQFILALGEQCFLNEYIYSFSEDENISVNAIIKKCINGDINEEYIAILSCYFPLYKLLDQIPRLKSFNSSNQSFKELIELQIIEPQKEIEFSKRIKRLGTINDDISQKVKSQYEENPYPRWRYTNHSESQKVSVMQGINNEIKPNYISHNLEDKQLKVLIAGCGTGKQILHAQRYKNTQITAIDLSLSSLAYAQRKINELGIDNIELIEMDILEVSLLEEQFDVIECSGVLHHMNNPSQGLRALVDVLNNNGFLNLGLYSELARQDIVKARNYIANKKLQANNQNIRDFRETIFSGKEPELNSLSKRSDFYTLSSCRDLCFHTKEHRFTINQLQEILKLNELEFLGFSLPQSVRSLYQQYFPDDKTLTYLQNWEKFEEKHPKTFAGMYQFWVSKL